MNQTTTPPPTPDLELWSPADLARFLRVDVDSLPRIVATAGVPVLYLGDQGLRAVPSVVRTWAASRSQSVIAPPTHAATKPSRRRVGGTATSGRLVQS